MLIEEDSFLYAYAITRDFGFAPNPFHGTCTLATCKPDIRKGAKVGDWILGIGGSNIKGASRKCILLMKVTKKISFQEYWEDSNYSIKKPLRNGSRVRMLGDNIYHRDADSSWLQEDSHHSQPDGSVNQVNLARDTKSDNVLISNCFLYFGETAVPLNLDSIGYHRIRNYKKIKLAPDNDGGKLIAVLLDEHGSKLNMAISDPCQFKNSHKRVDQATGIIS
jgi:hypothetical protein